MDRKIVNATTGEGKGNYLALTHTTYISNRLPPPYRTNCLHYETANFRSQKHCWNECVLKKSLDGLDMIPCAANFKLNSQTLEKYSNLNIDYKMHYTPKRTHLDSTKKIMLGCEELCSRLNCFEQVFVTKVVGRSAMVKLAFDLYLPDSPDVITNYIAKIELIEYAIFVLSCFGFWLGFSPLMVLLDSKFFKEKVETKGDLKIARVTPNPRIFLSTMVTHHQHFTDTSVTMMFILYFNNSNLR